MLAALCIASLMVADVPRVDASLIVGTGPGFSPNSTVVYVVPTVSLDAQVTLSGWYAGGGLEAHTYVDPRFFPKDDILRPMAVSCYADAGLVMFERERLRLLGDVSLLLGLHYWAIDDGTSFYGPALAAATRIRGELEIVDGVDAQLGIGLMVAGANFGVLEFVPQPLVGIGWRF